MFPNLTKNIHTQRSNTTIDIVSRVVKKTIMQSDNSINLSKKITKSNTILTKDAIYKSLETAYNHASKVR